MRCARPTKAPHMPAIKKLKLWVQDKARVAPMVHVPSPQQLAALPNLQPPDSGDQADRPPS